jgi:hypothetical protein
MRNRCQRQSPFSRAGWHRLLHLKVCVSEGTSHFPQISRKHYPSGNADSKRQESDVMKRKSLLESS